ncbi:MAG TPA: LysR substrate-binding domain-containing protein [Burkholderiales bacterium]|nr:LysR substrate-binding domain-containing protein [Burkholderiales bacterium]
MARSAPAPAAGRAPATPLPSLRQLRYLTVLAEKLNFRAAAEACFVTQSTLSAGIQELERTLGTQLVERDKRSVRLTAAGEEVTARARRLLSEAADLVEIARAARAPLTGSFRLGAIPTIAPFVLPRVLPRIRARHPGLKLFLREDLTERLLEQLRAGELDAALIALPYDTAELEVRKLARDDFHFVARKDHPLAALKSVPVERLDPAEVILLEEGHCLREHAIEACSRIKRPHEAIRHGPRIEATSLPTLLQMVEGGLGVTLLPETALKADLLQGTGLVARPFSSRVPARTLALAARPSSARGRDLDLLADFLKRS